MKSLRVWPVATQHETLWHLGSLGIGRDSDYLSSYYCQQSCTINLCLHSTDERSCEGPDSQRSSCQLAQRLVGLLLLGCIVGNFAHFCRVFSSFGGRFRRLARCNPLRFHRPYAVTPTIPVPRLSIRSPRAVGLVPKSLSSC